MGASEENPRELKKELRGWQIFFIVLSIAIGTGIFSFNGGALNVAGPGGFILAMIVVGVVVICFMDGLAEMIQVFPCTNALIEYVNYFVDPDLAQCCGWAYWLAWSCFTSLQVISAADFTADWLKNQQEVVEYLVRIVAFYMPAPVLLYAINSFSVRLFGWIETVAGLIKLVACLAIGLVLFSLGGKTQGIWLDHECEVTGRPLPGTPGFTGNETIQLATHLQDGFTRNEWLFPNQAFNTLAAIPIVVFCWTGVEVVAITAFEAKSLKTLRQPAQWVPYVLFSMFIVVSIGSAMSVKYDSTFIPLFYGAQVESEQSKSIACTHTPFTSTKVLAIVASLGVGDFNLASAINVFMVFSALSAANSGLYTASRVLYGLTFKTHPRQRALRRLYDWLGQLNKSHVPRRALLISMGAFCWYPFLVFIGTHPYTDTSSDDQQFAIILPDFLSTVGSTAIIFVWGAQCLAFIRYHDWFLMHKDGLIEKRYPIFNRWARRGVRRTSTFLRPFQPGVAYLGLIGTCLIVFILPSALLWSGKLQAALGKRIAYEVIRLYLAQTLIMAGWLSLKLIQWYERGSFRNIEWFVRLDTDPEKLDDVIRRLESLAEESQPTTYRGPV